MKLSLKTTTLISLTTTMFFASCHTSQTIVGNLDGNNLQPGIDALRKTNPRIYDGDVVILNIQNLNKDLYQVKITSGVASYNTTVPSSLSLSSLIIPGSIGIPNTNGSNGLPFTPDAALKTDKTDAIIKNKVAPSVKLSCAQLVQNERNIISLAASAFKTAVNNINEVVAFNNYIQSLQKDCGLTATQIKSAADAELKKIIPSGQLTDLKTFTESNVSDAEKQYTVIDESHAKLDAYFGCDSCKTSLAATDKTFTDSENSSFADMKTDFATVVTFQQTNQEYLIMQNYKAVTNPSNYAFSAIDTARFADELNFTVSIAPKNWLPCRAVDTTFNLKLKVSRFKIDFSTGVFLNWGGDNFTGKNYFLDANNKIQQINQNVNTYIPSIGALTHFYYSNGAAIEPGLVLGTSLSTDVKYTNFHLGISLMFNTNNEIYNRIALSGGLTYRYISDLTSNYPVGTVLDTNLTLPQVETGRFIRGGFIALTYNLSAGK